MNPRAADDRLKEILQKKIIFVPFDSIFENVTVSTFIFAVNRKSLECYGYD